MDKEKVESSPLFSIEAKKRGYAKVLQPLRTELYRLRQNWWPLQESSPPCYCGLFFALFRLYSKHQGCQIGPQCSVSASQSQGLSKHWSYLEQHQVSPADTCPVAVSQGCQKMLDASLHWQKLPESKKLVLAKCYGMGVEITTSVTPCLWQVLALWLHLVQGSIFIRIFNLYSHIRSLFAYGRGPSGPE